jgi:hypothetical protein
MIEEWKPVQTYPYEVSNLGRVRRSKPGIATHVGKIQKPARNKSGYLYVTLADRANGLPEKYALVHSLVAEAFLGPKPEGLQANHKDGNRANPCLENLEYLTASENTQDGIKRFGRWYGAVGEKHGMAILTEEQVRCIRTEYVPRKVPCRVLAIKYGVSLTTIHEAVSGKRVWRNVS